MATKFGPKKLHSSVLCKKSGNLLHVQWDFGAGEFQYAIRIFKEPRELPCQPNLNKNKVELY